MELTLTRPDDFHLHLRDGDAMLFILPHTAHVFGRALVMPNLAHPVTTVQQAIDYRHRILEALSKAPRQCSGFEPLMTIYLTNDTSPTTIAMASATECILAAKLYPAHATTNAAHGVTDIEQLSPVFETMAERGLVLSIHGELLADAHGEVDVFDREKRFLEETLFWIVDSYPELKVVLEHITTKEAVRFVEETRTGVAATITAHHLLENRNAIFRGGIQPHHYCLPVLKREADREALLLAATSGNPKFFLGTDSAPHAKSRKESACGCAGCFTAPVALPLYAQAFHSIGALDRLEGFASFFGADFYGLPRNTDTVTLVEKAATVPMFTAFGNDDIVVTFWAGHSIDFSVKPE